MPSHSLDDPLDTERILQRTFAARVEHHRTLGSTNDRAKRWAGHGTAELPVVIVADRQRAGRGRGSRRWWTGPGGLAVSLLIDPGQFGIDPAGLCLVSLAGALAVVDAVGPRLPSRTVGLYWPNDVYVLDRPASGRDRAQGGVGPSPRKVAGVLVEAPSRGRVIIGIGVNTNNTLRDAPEALRGTAATLRDLTGRRHDRTEVLVDLLQRLQRWLDLLGRHPGEVGREADRRCLQRGQMLRVETGRHALGGRCLGIAPHGALRLQTPAGVRECLGGAVRLA